MSSRMEVENQELTIASDSDGEVGASELNDSAIDNKRVKPVINRTVVSKAPKKRVTMSKPATAKKTTKAKAPRTALKDRTNIKDGNDTEEVEDFADEIDAGAAAVKPKAKKQRTIAPNPIESEDAPPKKKRATKTKPAAEEQAQAAQIPPADATKPKSKKRAVSVEPLRTIPETQPEPMQDVSESIEVDTEEMDMDEEPAPKPVQKIVQRARSASQQRQAAPAIPPRARSVSQQARHFSRGRSASDAERRLADSESKRHLTELKSKYDDLHIKYESLQDLGRNGQESNFEKLKRATDQRAKDANDLIASLKKELSDLRKSSSSSTAENARMQSQIASLESDTEKNRAETKTLQSSLLESQNEVKSLSAKLEAARKSASTATESSKTPGSAMKNSSAVNRNHLNGNLDNTKQAVLKEELYRDLTGLIINSIKRKDGEDEYSCIQTGRNGTLHFHLTINNDSTNVNPKTPSGLSYEDAEFAYEPFFDEDRDRDLIDILPDYLTEEICFPRNHAVKFYGKVVDSMTRRIEVED